MSPLGTERRVICLFAALAMLSAPAYAGDKPEVFKCSARGGPEWREYRSKHFLLTTDLSTASAGPLVKDLERIRAMVLQAMVGEQVEIPGRVRVIAFRDPGQFHELAPAWVSGLFLVTRHTMTPTVVLPIAGMEGDPETVAHELVHHFSWFLFPRQPRWFSEGLAQFIQTVASLTIENEPAPAIGSHIVRGEVNLRGGVGVMPRYLGPMLREIRPVPVKELLDWRGPETTVTPGSFHIQSWLLYHWLWNNRSKAFTDFQSRLSNAEDPLAAWRASFPEFDPIKPGALDSLDNTLERYRKSARYGFYRVTAAGDGTFVESKLSTAEVHLILLELRALALKPEARDALLHAELDEALAEDPMHPIAISWRAQLEKSSPVDALRKASSVRPNDYRAWLSLGRALQTSGDPAGAESAYRTAVSLNAESVEAQAGLASVLVSKGRSKEALQFANRAVELAPWSEVTVATLAGVAFTLGKCTEALLLQRRAVSLIDSNEGGVSLEPLEKADLYLKRLREYEARCGPTASK